MSCIHGLVKITPGGLQESGLLRGMGTKRAGWQRLMERAPRPLAVAQDQLGCCRLIFFLPPLPFMTYWSSLSPSEPYLLGSGSAVEEVLWQ